MVELGQIWGGRPPKRTPWSKVLYLSQCVYEIDSQIVTLITVDV